MSHRLVLCFSRGLSNESDFAQRNPIVTGYRAYENKAEELCSKAMRFFFARNIPINFGDKFEYRVTFTFGSCFFARNILIRFPCLLHFQSHIDVQNGQQKKKNSQK